MEGSQAIGACLQNTIKAYDLELRFDLIADASGLYLFGP